MSYSDIYKGLDFVGMKISDDEKLKQIKFSSGLSIFNTEEFLSNFCTDYKFVKFNNDETFQNGMIITKRKNRFGWKKFGLPRMSRTSGYVFISRSEKQERLERDIDEFLDKLYTLAPNYSFINFESNLSSYLANKVHKYRNFTINRNISLDLFNDESKSGSKIIHIYKENIRRQIKKSDKIYNYERIEITSDIFNKIKETFNRNGMPMPLERKDQIFLRTMQVKHPEIINCIGAIKKDDGKLDAVIIILNDILSYRYMYSGVEKNALQSGVVSGLINYSIKMAAEREKRFDFCGSNSASIARFFHAFGAKSELYITARK